MESKYNKPVESMQMGSFSFQGRAAHYAALNSLFLEDIVSIMPSILQRKHVNVFLYNDNILYFLMTGFIGTLFLPGMPVLNNIFIGLLVFYSFFYNTFSEKMRLFRQRSSIQWMFVFFLLHIISYFLSKNRHEAAVVLEMRSTLLLFPLSIGLIVIKDELKEKIILIYGAITALVAFTCLITALLLFGKNGDASVLYNDSLSFPIRMQSVYFAMLINIAVACIAWLLYKRNSVVKYRGLLYLFLFILLVVHFLLASRIAVIILYSGMLIFAFYNIIKKRKILEGATLVLGLFIGVFMLIKFFPKTVNRFREMMYTSYSYDSKSQESHYNMEVTKDQWNGANIRLAIWNCGWELVKQNPVMGSQIGDKQDKLQEIYKAKDFMFAYNSKRNMHNTYLDVFGTFGVVGLIVFLFGYIILPLVFCIRERNALSAFIVVAFAVSLATESYLDRSLGGLLLSFFITFTMVSEKRLIQES